MTVKRRKVHNVGEGIDRPEIDALTQKYIKDAPEGDREVELLRGAKADLLAGIHAKNEENAKARFAAADETGSLGRVVTDLPRFLDRGGARSQRIGDKGLDEVLLKLGIFLAKNKRLL